MAEPIFIALVRNAADVQEKNKSTSSPIPVSSSTKPITSTTSAPTISPEEAKYRDCVQEAFGNKPFLVAPSAPFANTMAALDAVNVIKSDMALDTELYYVGSKSVSARLAIASAFNSAKFDWMAKYGPWYDTSVLNPAVARQLLPAVRSKLSEALLSNKYEVSNSPGAATRAVPLDLFRDALVIYETSPVIVDVESKKLEFIIQLVKTYFEGHVDSFGKVPGIVKVVYIMLICQETCHKAEQQARFVYETYKLIYGRNPPTLNALEILDLFCTENAGAHPTNPNEPSYQALNSCSVLAAKGYLHAWVWDASRCTLTLWMKMANALGRFLGYNEEAIKDILATAVMRSDDFIKFLIANPAERAGIDVYTSICNPLATWEAIVTIAAKMDLLAQDTKELGLKKDTSHSVSLYRADVNPKATVNAISGRDRPVFTNRGGKRYGKNNKPKDGNQGKNKDNTKGNDHGNNRRHHNKPRDNSPRSNDRSKFFRVKGKDVQKFRDKYNTRSNSRKEGGKALLISAQDVVDAVTLKLQDKLKEDAKAKQSESSAGVLMLQTHNNESNVFSPPSELVQSCDVQDDTQDDAQGKLQPGLQGMLEGTDVPYDQFENAIKEAYLRFTLASEDAELVADKCEIPRGAKEKWESLQDDSQVVVFGGADVTKSLLIPSFTDSGANIQLVNDQFAYQLAEQTDVVVIRPHPCNYRHEPIGTASDKGALYCTGSHLSTRIFYTEPQDPSQGCFVEVSACMIDSKSCNLPHKLLLTREMMIKMGYLVIAPNKKSNTNDKPSPVKATAPRGIYAIGSQTSQHPGTRSGVDNNDTPQHPGTQSGAAHCDSSHVAQGCPHPGTQSGDGSLNQQGAQVDNHPGTKSGDTLEQRKDRLSLAHIGNMLNHSTLTKRVFSDTQHLIDAVSANIPQGFQQHPLADQKVYEKHRTNFTQKHEAKMKELHRVKSPSKHPAAPYYPNILDNFDFNTLITKALIGRIANLEAKNQEGSAVWENNEKMIKNGLLVPIPQTLLDNPQALMFPIAQWATVLGRVVQGGDAFNPAIIPPKVAYDHNKGVLKGVNPRSRVFSSLDIRRAFHNCPYLTYEQWLESEHSKRGNPYIYFAVHHNNQMFMFAVMFFGLRDASAHWLTFRNAVIPPDPNRIPYVDDIFMQSESPEEHEEVLLSTIDRILDAGMSAGEDKAVLFQERVKFLGCIIKEGGIEPDPEKLKQIQQMPNPQTPKQIKSFAGAIAFNSSFILGRSSLLSKLVELSNLPQKHKFNAATQAIVDKEAALVKAELGKCVALSFPLEHEQLHVFTDASREGIAGVIGVVRNEKFMVVDIWSRSLSTSEKNYTVFRLELLAIVCALNQWESLLLPQRFCLYTDNMALSIAMDCNRNDMKKVTIQWLQRILEFSFDMYHVPGESNALADFLSRHPSATVPQLEKRTPPKSDFEMEAHMFTLRANLSTYDNTLSGARRRQELEEAHYDHSSQFIMMNRINQKGFHDSNLMHDCTLFVKQCKACAAYNAVKRTFSHPMSITASSPFDHMILDLAGPLPDGINGEKYVLVAVCAYTGFVVYECLMNKTSAEVCDALAKIFCIFGCPKILSSDHGGEFEGLAVQDLVKKLCIEYRFSASYNPRCNGRAEIKVHAFKTLIEKLLYKKSKDKQNLWPNLVRYVQFLVNTRESQRTLYSPFYLVYGRVPVGVNNGDCRKFIAEKFDHEDWMKHITHHVNVTADKVEKQRAKQQSAVEKRLELKKLISASPLKQGDRVMVKNMTAMRPLFQPRYYGPYHVDHMDEFNNYFLKADNQEDTPVMTRKFPRVQLKLVSDNINFGGFEPIVMIRKLQHFKDPDENVDEQFALVVYMDYEMDEEWIPISSLNTDVQKEITLNSRKKKAIWPLKISNAVLKKTYGLQDDEIRNIAYE